MPRLAHELVYSSWTLLADRPPYVDDTEPVHQQLRRLGAQVVTDPARRRVHRIILDSVTDGSVSR